jgi:putative transposase
LLEATIEAIIMERPLPTKQTPQHLCLDKAYDNSGGEETAYRHNYIPHIRRIGEEKLDDAGEKRYPARR